MYAIILVILRFFIRSLSFDVLEQLSLSSAFYNVFILFSTHSYNTQWLFHNKILFFIFLYYFSEYIYSIFIRLCVYCINLFSSLFIIRLTFDIYIYSSPWPFLDVVTNFMYLNNFRHLFLSRAVFISCNTDNTVNAMVVVHKTSRWTASNYFSRY